MADFYCDEVLSGKTPIRKMAETESVLAFFHTRPSYEEHIVVIPKRHIPSLTALEATDDGLLLEMMSVIKTVVAQVMETRGACRVITNLGAYQETKHLHFHIVSGERISSK